MIAAESAAGTTVGPVGAALVVLLVLVGSFFLVVGTVGLFRLPNVYNRLHATTKATTLGVSGIALAAWVYFGPAGQGLKALVTILFLFLTAPTGSHMISRAAQRMGVEFEEGVTWPSRTGAETERAGENE
ncbi:monovalent cation/H(+) antiporter subunit G [Halorarum halobium]|uniref:monovalent cation/H(+) antiporter subunit G n=1 Tax=Halorarum halobium TaxID=3075121 RepID=UPI0028AC0E83|nr:monovalent cation/H(+) antiporter subunit G [Halobaculum sp. XH14]